MFTLAILSIFDNETTRLVLSGVITKKNQPSQDNWLQIGKKLRLKVACNNTRYIDEYGTVNAHIWIVYYTLREVEMINSKEMVIFWCSKVWMNEIERGIGLKNDFQMSRLKEMMKFFMYRMMPSVYTKLTNGM